MSSSGDSSSSPSTPLTSANRTYLSRCLSKILRHAGPSMGLTMDSHGYADVEELLALPQMRRMGFANLQTIQEAVRECPKQRFHMLKPNEASGGAGDHASTGWRIRANQGHNAKLATLIDPMALMTPITTRDMIPKSNLCLHGTTRAAWSAIVASGGLHPMGRTHIHFASEDYGSAEMISGMRRSSEILIHLDLGSILDWITTHIPHVSLRFFQSSNSVLLTEGLLEYSNMLPTFLFQRIEELIRQDGGKIVRRNLEWSPPSEEEWFQNFGERHATRTSIKEKNQTNTNQVRRTATTTTTSSTSSSSSSSSGVGVSPPVFHTRPAPRPSPWGPPATSRPPPGWIVPPHLAHIVNGTPAPIQANAASSSSSSSPSKLVQPFRYLAVLDFEATCDDHSKNGSASERFTPQEVIEFPIVLIDTSNGTTIDTFHAYVRPMIHPRLTPFCTELTGITQEQVDHAEPFEQVWKEVHRFLKKHQLLTNDEKDEDSSTSVAHPFTFVTCGDWDLQRMLGQQLSITFPPTRDNNNVTPPSHFSSWVNLKLAFNDFYRPKVDARGMTDLLMKLNLPMEGRHHSGMDDTKNLARVCQRMIQDGCIFRTTTTTIPQVKSNNKSNPKTSPLAEALRRNQQQPTRNQSQQ